MKKTLVSLAAASLIVTGAMAADAEKKGVDFVTTGQAVVYYETKATDTDGDAGFFHQDNSMANVGLQLNTTGNLGNGFTLGSQLTYLGTLGLENNAVSSTRMDVAQSLNGTTTDELMLTQINISKKVGNTTVKLGRQELPKGLSPFAYSEKWNVFKNTFDAALVVNTDVPDTTLVGAYVSGTTTTFDANKGTLGSLVTGLEVYMLTAQNKSIPLTTLTGTYYSIPSSHTVAWLDAKVAGDLPFGLTAGLQGGQIAYDDSDMDSATAFGLKVAAKPVKNLMVQLAYSSTDENGVFKNATGVKTPLYTQMIYNQNFISTDADTIHLKVAYNAGDIGTFAAVYGASTYNASTTENEYSELDLIYKVKSGGVTYWASAMLRDIDGFADNKVRLWARLGF